MKIKSIYKRSALFLFLCLLGINGAFAKDIPAKSDKLVNDYAGVLSAQEKQMLESKLVQFNNSSGTQIAVVLDKSLEGEDVFDYSQRLAEAWGIGQKGKNNGLLIYASIPDRKMWIQVGYGLEPVVTDAVSSQIYRDVLAPAFKQGQYFQGLDKATTDLMGLASKEFTPDQYVKTAPQPKVHVHFSPFLIFIVIFIIIAVLGGGRGGRGGWLPLLFLGGMMGGGGSRGGSDFGGGGGGFGGFGGGSFGGGGAGGSW